MGYGWIQSQLCELSQVPPPSCFIPEEEQPEESGEEGSNSELSDYTSSEVMSAIDSPAVLDSTQSQSNITTVLSTTLSLQVDVQYDDYPQEISWAVAEEKEEPLDSSFSNMKLVHISRRQPVTARGELISQEILNVERGSTFRLEFYDQISGDGIAAPLEGDAIQVWRVETTVETTYESDVPVRSKQLKQVSELLWFHRGDFGEFVRANVDVA